MAWIGAWVAMQSAQQRQDQDDQDRYDALVAKGHDPWDASRTVYGDIGEPDPWLGVFLGFFCLVALALMIWVVVHL